MRDPGFLDLLRRLPLAKRVLLVSDGRPDGDSLGSTTATFQWLRRDFPHLFLRAFCREQTPPSLLCLDEILSVEQDEALFSQPWDLIILHDAGDLAHAKIEDLLPRTPPGYVLVNIDHHSTNARYGAINIVQTDACSTTQVLYRCFLENGVVLHAGIASSLLGGLLTDTGAFTNSSTNADSLTMAAHLIRVGGRYQELLRSTLTHHRLEGLQLQGKAFARLKKHPVLDVATTYIQEKDYAHLADEEASSGVSNALSAICGDAEMVLVLKETDDGMVNGSFRSNERDISRFCRALGGGGHKRAAGFHVPGRILEKTDGTIAIQDISTHNI